MKKILLLALIVLVYQGQNKASLPATIIGFHFGYLIGSLIDTRAFEEFERSTLFQSHPTLLSAATGMTGSGISYIIGTLISPDHITEFYGGSTLAMMLASYQHQQRRLLAAQSAQDVNRNRGANP